MGVETEGQRPTVFIQTCSRPGSCLERWVCRRSSGGSLYSSSFEGFNRSRFGCKFKQMSWRAPTTLSLLLSWGHKYKNTQTYSSFQHALIYCYASLIHVSFIKIIFTSVSCDSFRCFFFNISPPRSRGLWEQNASWLHSWVGAYKEPSRWSITYSKERGAELSPAGQECWLPTEQINS